MIALRHFKPPSSLDFESIHVDQIPVDDNFPCPEVSSTSTDNQTNNFRLYHATITSLKEKLSAGLSKINAGDDVKERLSSLHSKIENKIARINGIKLRIWRYTIIERKVQKKIEDRQHANPSVTVYDTSTLLEPRFIPLQSIFTFGFHRQIL